MPVAVLKFKLPEESEEFELANQAQTMRAFIDTFANELRKRYKHAEAPNEAAYKEWEEIKKLFYDTLAEYKLDDC